MAQTYSKCAVWPPLKNMSINFTTFRGKNSLDHVTSVERVIFHGGVIGGGGEHFGQI